jgi:CHAD domain-containing protein
MYQSKSGKFLYHFYKERDSIFMQHFERLQIRLDEEDIHNLRRAGKRIKALFQLFEEIKPEFNYPKRFQPIKDVFNNAGFLREIQVNINTLNSYKPSTLFVKTYGDFVANKRLVFKNQLVTAINSFSFKKHEKSVRKVKKLCQDITHREIMQATDRYIKYNLNQIEQYIKQERTDENVHAIRIHLKRISPVTNLLAVIKVPEFLSEILTLKTAEDKLGYWHDRVVLLETLRQMKKLYPIPKELLTDFNWLINQLTSEHNSFIVHMNELIIPCINLLHETKITSDV